MANNEKMIDQDKTIYALELWMKRIEQGVRCDDPAIDVWALRWKQMKKVVERWKEKGEIPK